MQVKNTYYVKRNGIYIWLSHLVEPLPEDEIIEIRRVLVADEGKTLIKNGEIVGGSIWLQGDDDPSEYEEIDEPAPEVPEEENEQP